MITIELWGPTNKGYGPVFEKKTEIQHNLRQAYEFVKQSMKEDFTGWIKVFVNGKFVPTYNFMEQYRKTHPEEKPNLKIYIEQPSGKFALVDEDTKKDVFVGDKWEVEKYLDEHGYFDDDNPMFTI